MITWIFGIHHYYKVFFLYLFLPSTKSNTIWEEEVGRALWQATLSSTWRDFSRVNRVAIFAGTIGWGDGVSPRSPLDKEHTRDGHGHQTEAEDAEKGGRTKHWHTIGQINPEAQIRCQIGTQFEPNQREKHPVEISHGTGEFHKRHSILKCERSLVYIKNLTLTQYQCLVQ